MTTEFWTAYAVKLGVLALVLGALYAIARRLRHAGLFRRDARRCIDVVETAMLTPQVSLHLVRVGKRHVLVGATSSSARSLVRWTSEDEPLDVEVAELREFVPGLLD